MTPLLGVSIGCVVTAVALGLLLWRDPKRRRAHRLRGVTWTRRQTQMLWLCALAPGLILALQKASAAFALWAAVAPMLAWLLTLAAPTQRWRNN